MDLDGLGVKLKTFLLVGKELLKIFPLVSLQLNHITHFSVGDDGAIASWVHISLTFVAVEAGLLIAYRTSS